MTFRRQSLANHSAQRGSVFLWKSRNLYLGPALNTSIHVPYCVKVCVAIQGSFRLCSVAGKSASYRAAIIPSGMAHQLDGQGSAVATLRLNPDTLEARRLISSYSNNQIVSLSWDAVSSVHPRLRLYLDQGCSPDEADGLFSELISHLTSPGSRYLSFDSRIAVLLEYFQSVSLNHMTAREAAALTNLSPDRFMHLFREQVGLSFRRYQLGLRLRAALQEMRDEKSLTDLAHKVGFADAAHLTRTARLMLGHAPSSLFAHQWWIEK